VITEVGFGASSVVEGGDNERPLWVDLSRIGPAGSMAALAALLDQ
jgi:hypothetical protein